MYIDVMSILKEFFYDTNRYDRIKFIKIKNFTKG